MNYPSSQDMNNLAELLLEHAYQIFVDCGAEEDFCLQVAGAQAAVFGGRNRVIWSPAGGWRADPGYCSPRFMEAWMNSEHSDP